jgi:hypothetical protein
MARVQMAGTFDPEFHRNRKLRRLLERNGHEVTVCREPVWGTDRVATFTQGKLAALGRAVLGYPRLIWRFLRAERSDLVLITYPGWLDATAPSRSADSDPSPVDRERALMGPIERQHTEAA